jgi:hypothetical protein
MAKFNKASDYVIRWRAKGHPTAWIACQVFGLVGSGWRGWKAADYQLSFEEAETYALVENLAKNRKAQEERERERAKEERRRAQEEFDRTAILAPGVCAALGCSKDELQRWKNTNKIPPDGKRGRVHAWLPATVEAAMSKVTDWRREDLARNALCKSVAGLKARGWTDSLIKMFLGNPDMLARNPHYASASEMRLYLLERVETAARTLAFQQRRAKLAEQAARRKASAAVNEAADRAMVAKIYRSMLPH